MSMRWQKQRWKSSVHVDRQTYIICINPHGQRIGRGINKMMHCSCNEATANAMTQTPPFGVTKLTALCWAGQGESNGNPLGTKVISSFRLSLNQVRLNPETLDLERPNEYHLCQELLPRAPPILSSDWPEEPHIFCIGTALRSSPIFCPGTALRSSFITCPGTATRSSPIFCPTPTPGGRQMLRNPEMETFVCFRMTTTTTIFWGWLWFEIAVFGRNYELPRIFTYKLFCCNPLHTV